MLGYPSVKREWVPGKKLRAIKAAGFDGVVALFDSEWKAGADRLGLAAVSGFDCRTAADAMPRLRTQRDLGVKLINIQLMDHDTPPAIAAGQAIKLVRAGRKMDLQVHIEVHRDTATETPEKFDEIARIYQQKTGELIPVTWDHSHFAVVKHVLPKDYSARLLVWPKLIQHSQLFHLRPFNSQHCQVPILSRAGRLTPEFKDYLGFVEDLFRLWLQGPRPGNALWVCPEMGMSHGYHLSLDPLPWPGVVRARAEFASAWRRALKR